MSPTPIQIGIVLPIHARHYTPEDPRLSWFLKTIRSTLAANGWTHAKTLYLKTDTESVPDRECWTSGDVKTDSKGVMSGSNRKSVRVKVDWIELINTKLKTPELRKLLLERLDSAKPSQSKSIRITLK